MCRAKSTNFPCAHTLDVHAAICANEVFVHILQLRYCWPLVLLMLTPLFPVNCVHGAGVGSGVCKNTWNDINICGILERCTRFNSNIRNFVNSTDINNNNDNNNSWQPHSRHLEAYSNTQFMFGFFSIHRIRINRCACEKQFVYMIIFSLSLSMPANWSARIYVQVTQVMASTINWQRQ